MDLAERYCAARRATEALAEPLSAEDCGLQSMDDASPTKWHLGHTTWFFETMVLAPRGAAYTPFHPAFRSLFNSYYQSVGEAHPRPRRGLLSRPSLEEVLAYRRFVDEAVLARLGDPETHATVELGIHHEQQHQELVLTDILHALASNPLEPAYRGAPPPPRGRAAPLRWRAHEAGVRSLGHAGPGFAFDNERPRHRVFVEAFELATRPVTNAEYQEFVADGGYRRPELWLSDGWAAAHREGWSAPLYWRGESGDASCFSLDGRQALRPEDPVCHVSGFEADAFARWAGARLPTEAEWETAADAAIEGNFVETGWLAPRPTPDLGERPAALFGDVWEWTASPYVPYPGFQPLAGALGEYNGKFMSGQLVLRGGSCATPRSHIRRTYRNFFYPHQRWQWSGIRLAR